MKSSERERRDWSLLIFIVPIGILLMMLVGQLAIRIIPFWTVNVGMSSKLDPDTEPHRPFSIFQPLLPQILTPMSWAGTYLTPSGNISFPPFFVFEPGAANSPTPVSPTQTVPTLIETATSATPVGSVSPPPVGSTTKPPTSPVPTTATTPPTNEPSPTPTVPSPTPTVPSPTSTVPSPTPTVPSLTSTVPSPIPTEPSPVPTGYPSTPDPAWSYVPPPGNVSIGPPDGTSGGLNQGTYTVFNISGSPITVNGSSDWDLAYYEVKSTSGDFIRLDNVIIGISNSSPTCGSSFYVVFNWGDISDQLTNDYNTNITSYMENDNQIVNLTDLYNSPAWPSTGILINVDHAASQPPPGVYTCLVVISPYKAGSDAVAVDAIQIFP
jgi:hypothetical protein